MNPNDENIAEEDDSVNFDPLEVLTREERAMEEASRIDAVQRATFRWGDTVLPNIQVQRTTYGGINRSPDFFEVRAERSDENAHYALRQNDRANRSQNEIRNALRRNLNPSPIDRGPYRLRTGTVVRPAGPNDNTQCLHCTRYFDRYSEIGTVEIEGSYICVTCAHDYVQCPRCRVHAHLSDVHLAINPSDANVRERICHECFVHDYSACTQCYIAVFNGQQCERTNEAGVVSYYCTNCFNAMDEDNEDLDEEISEAEWEGAYRDFYNGDKKYCGDGVGKIIASNRIFSAEIECFAPNQEILDKVSKKTPHHLGIGSDGSLSSSKAGKGVEFRTPVLRGKKGEDFLVKLTDILNSEGFYTNKSCGLHVHLDGGQIVPKDSINVNPIALKNLWLTYLVYEDIILSFLPNERRNNGYCRQMRNNFHISEIWNAQNLEEIEKVWYRTQSRMQIVNNKGTHHHDSRYNGVNLHCLLSENHMEIRFHSGTINGTKILEWVNLHQTIMDKAAQLTQNTITQGSNIFDYTEKRDYFLSILGLPKRSCDYFVKRSEKFKVKDAVEDLMPA